MVIVICYAVVRPNRENQSHELSFEKKNSFGAVITLRHRARCSIGDFLQPHESEFIAPQSSICRVGSEQCLNSIGERQSHTDAYKMPKSPPSPGNPFVAIRTIGLTTRRW